MFSKFLKSFFVTILCIFAVSSCAFFSDDKGLIQFTLPDVNASQRYRSAEKESGKSSYDVLLKSKNGSVFYNEKHAPGAKVVISNIPAGYYEIVITHNTPDDFLEGRSYITVTAGRETSVIVEMKRISRPGELTINFTFTGKPERTVPLTLSIINADTNKPVDVSEYNKNLTSNKSSIVVKGLDKGNYNVSINGRSEYVIYKGTTEKPVSVESGSNKELNIVIESDTTLLFVDAYNGNDNNSGIYRNPFRTLSKAISYIEEKDPKGEILYEVAVKGTVNETKTIEITRPGRIIIHREAGQDNSKVQTGSGSLISINNPNAEITINGLDLQGGSIGNNLGCINVMQGTLIMEKGSINQGDGSNLNAIYLKDKDSHLKIGGAGKINGNIYLDGDSYITVKESLPSYITNLVTLQLADYTIGRKVVTAEKGINIKNYGIFRIHGDKYIVDNNGELCNK